MARRRAEGEKILRSLERQGWRIRGGGDRYHLAMCPCGDHMKTIHLTPSDVGYYRKLRIRLRNHTCWTDDL